MQQGSSSLLIALHISVSTQSDSKCVVSFPDKHITFYALTQLTSHAVQVVGCFKVWPLCVSRA